MPGKLSHPALGLPSMEVRTGTLLAQAWLSLTRGCCCCLLGPKFCLPGAAGRSRDGHRQCLPWFSWSSQSCQVWAAAGCGLQGCLDCSGGCLGEPVAVLGVMPLRWDGAGSAGEASVLTDPSPQVLPVPLWCRSHPAPQGEMFTSYHTKSGTLSKRLFHRPNLFSNLKTALLEKSRSARRSPTIEPEEGMSSQGKAARGSWDVLCAGTPG